MSDRLLQLKRQIEDKKRQQDILVGRREEKMRQLKELGASSLEEAKEMLDVLTKMVNEKKKTIPTQMFLDLELFLRTILEKKGMLTPKRDLSGL